MKLATIYATVYGGVTLKEALKVIYKNVVKD
jgi:hypothetical protein